MQRPFLQAEAAASAKKTHFNKCFSAARRNVESVFGILTSRFRGLNRLHGNPENVKLIINSTMVLHNLRVRTVTTDELLTRFPPDPVPISQVLNQYSRAESRPDAQLERTRFMEYFASRDGNA
ncbi:unnamed protein product [Heligmosomoides polygyrus]|uniref:DDE Tnp4 domain-containing protein n=1 Tax=Heligmosomoides polygyrus TaxID=6339 RepID=A0A183GUQ1_HELPZ|nr:unnamed protein product [Heligmosomoides polygyrus]